MAEQDIMTTIYEGLSIKPSPGDSASDLVSAIQSLYDEYKTAYRDEWDRLTANEKMYNGDHWSDTGSGSNEPQPVMPIIFSTVENIQADLMDEYPEAVITPESSNDEKIGKILTRVVAQNHEACDYLYEYNDLIHDLLVGGYMIQEVGWDPTLNYGFWRRLHMFCWASLAHDLHFVALRYFNACGAHPDGNIGEAHDPETHLIPLVLQVPNGQRSHVDIFGDDYDTRDGTYVRDYIHVCDLASAHVLAAEYLMSGGKNDVFNLGNGVGFTVKEIVEASEKVVGRPIPAKIAPRRAGDPAQLVASSEKAKKVLGWKPKFHDIDTIISTAWRWHSAHPHGYKA